MSQYKDKQGFNSKELLINLCGLMVVYVILGMLLVFLGLLTPGQV
jgi:hypothetical protein